MIRAAGALAKRLPGVDASAQPGRENPIGRSNPLPHADLGVRPVPRVARVRSHANADTNRTEGPCAAPSRRHDCPVACRNSVQLRLCALASGFLGRCTGCCLACRACPVSRRESQVRRIREDVLRSGQLGATCRDHGDLLREVRLRRHERLERRHHLYDFVCRWTLRCLWRTQRLLRCESFELDQADTEGLTLRLSPAFTRMAPRGAGKTSPSHHARRAERIYRLQAIAPPARPSSASRTNSQRSSTVAQGTETSSYPQRSYH